MSIFTYHLVKTSCIFALKAILFPLKNSNIPGLIDAETMISMTLGSLVFSPSRMLIRQVVVFAQWKDEQAVDHFLAQHHFGKVLAKGWHTRLVFTRQWGKINAFEIPDQTQEFHQPNTPIVAITLARMKLFQVPRFIRWGKPVEKLVRDHPGTTFSLASIRLPRTVSTFSIWKSQQEMTDMVHGHSNVPQPKRHINAMKERDRKDFHFEFTTLRFRPIAEFGEWKGRKNLIPNLEHDQ